MLTAEELKLLIRFVEVISKEENKKAYDSL
jgi:hypothetical protein